MSKYDSTYDLEVLYLLALPDRPLMVEVVERLGISMSTYYEWRRDHSTFRTAVENGIKLRKKNVNFKPKKYNSSYCKKACEYMAEGYSITSVAAMLGVGRPAIYEWIDNKPEFAAAIEYGRSLEQHQHEKVGMLGTQGKIEGFNASSWNTIMKSRFGYTDKVEHSGNPDAPMNTHMTIEFVKAPDNDEED